MNKSEIIDMKLRGYIYYLLILSVVFSACTQLEEDMMSDGGRFNITLSDSKSDKSRSLPSELSDELTSEFYLTINHSNGVKAYKGKYSDYQIKQPAFKEGEYSIAASLGEDVLLALDSPYYESEDKLASIEVGKVTNVDLICYVANSLASFSFANTDQAKSLLQVYQIVTKVGDTEVSCTVDDGKNPYFRSGENVSFILKGTTSEGVSLDYTFANIPSVEKGKNYKYTISFGTSDTGNVGLDIAVDETIEDVTVNETVPENWLPKPTVSAQGFNEHGILEYTETEEAVNAAVSFQSYKPIENVKFTLNFGDRKLSSLNKSYELALLSPEDKSALEQAGIVLPVLNSTSGELNLKKVISGLLCADDGSSVDNNIVVSVFANDRWSDEKQYTIRTLKPEFGVTVNENDFWTKTFSVRGCEILTGNSETILSNLKYQYSEDNGSTWYDLNNSMTHKFDIAPDNKNLRVRALYRGTVPSTENDVVLEVPEQLPNSGMEEWREEIYKDSYYCFYPWNTDSNCHWDTNNLYTTRHRHNSGANTANYNGFHAVSYVYGRTGLAAEIRSTANGRGNTKFIGHTEQDYNKVSGELFTGSVNLTMGTSGVFGDADGSKDKLEIIKSAIFENRPTALKFWYKYIPYQSDTWSIHIELLDESNNIIVQNDFQSSEKKTDWNEVTVTLDFSEQKTYTKCKYIYIIFSSTINSGKNMPYGETTQTFYTNNGSETKTFSPAYVGSILTIDDISLVYDK